MADNTPNPRPAPLSAARVAELTLNPTLAETEAEKALVKQLEAIKSKGGIIDIRSDF